MPNPFLLTTFGISELALFFRLCTKASQDMGEAWVGSAVDYGPYNEFGTRFMEERPHWRIAIPEIISQIGGDPKMQIDVLDAMLSRDLSGEGFGQTEFDAKANAPTHIALLIERRVKQIMTQKGVIDTNNYRGSIATGRSEGDAWKNSVAKTKDGVTVA